MWTRSSSTSIYLLAVLLAVVACDESPADRLKVYRSTPTCENYFPPGMIPTKFPDRYDFTSAWYSVPLAALGEPCLYDYDSGQAQVYRFLWLPSFDPDVVVTFYSEGQYCRAWGNTVEWDFETFLPLEPKKIETGREVVVDLSVEQCTELQRALIEIDFWSLPVKIEYDLGNDGAQFIIQAIKGEQYHITDRWDPSEEYREIFKYVLNTAGLFNDRFEQY